MITLLWMVRPTDLSFPAMVSCIDFRCKHHIAQKKNEEEEAIFVDVLCGRAYHRLSRNNFKKFGQRFGSFSNRMKK